MSLPFDREKLLWQLNLLMRVILVIADVSFQNCVARAGWQVYVLRSRFELSLCVQKVLSYFSRPGFLATTRLSLNLVDTASRIFF